jgi:uncharacterized protein YggE
MSLIPESRDTLRRHEWFTLRPFAVIAVAVACVWSTALIVGGWQATHARPREPHTISAIATSKRHVVPDAVVWEATVTQRAADRITAIHQLGGAVERTRTYLLAHEVQAPELSVYPPSVEPDTQTITHSRSDGTADVTEVPNGFVATQRLAIHSADVARALRGFRAVATTLELGVIELPEPSCTVSSIDAIRDQLLALAHRDVRVRGEAAVSAIGGAHLGKLVSADEGKPSADGLGTPSLMVCERGADAVATVMATYELE